MSRYRNIHSDITIDKLVSRLCEDGPLAALLYTWGMLHADDWGRITGDAYEFKNLVCPALMVKASDVEAVLLKIEAAGLWRRYEVNGSWYIAYPRTAWFKHQSYIDKNKRTHDNSKFPAPPDENWLPWSDRNAQNKGQSPAGNAAQFQELPQTASKRQKYAPSPTPSPSPTKTDSEQKEKPESFVGRILSEYPHWAEPLEEAVRRRSPRSVMPFKAATLQNWLNGDGTPPSPPQTVSLSEDWKKGDRVEVRPGVFAEATHDKTASRLPLWSLRYPGAKMSHQEIIDSGKSPEWNGRRPNITEGRTSFPVPGWLCNVDKCHYTIGDDGYNSPPRKCDRDGNLFPDEGEAQPTGGATTIPVTAGGKPVAPMASGVIQC